ncbi:hypothetical protein OL229_05555 [Neisseriaceae bacterium JH1-16]|nr:hypothetical protein [Neisseriaceae bacterium JH1-16]
MPDYGTMCRYQKVLPVTIRASPTSSGLHLLAGIIGIRMLGEGGWKTKRYGADCRGQWCKVYLGIDTETLEVRVIEVTAAEWACSGGLAQILAEGPLLSVSGDGAYDIGACREAIASAKLQ